MKGEKEELDRPVTMGKFLGFQSLFEKRCEATDRRFARIDDRLDGIDIRLDNIENRLDNIEDQMVTKSDIEGLVQKVDAILESQRISQRNYLDMMDQLVDHEKRITVLEKC